MILIDANLLLHAYNASSEVHNQARSWLEKELSKPDPVRIAWEILPTGDFLACSAEVAAGNGHAAAHPEGFWADPEAGGCLTPLILVSVNGGHDFDD